MKVFSIPWSLWKTRNNQKNVLHLSHEMQHGKYVYTDRAGSPQYSVKGVKHFPEFVHFEPTSIEKDKGWGRGRIIGDFKIFVFYFSII